MSYISMWKNIPHYEFSTKIMVVSSFLTHMAIIPYLPTALLL